MNRHRRTFLKHLGLGGLLLSAGPGGLLVGRSEASSVAVGPNVGKVLVVVFLRGGCDGLNLLVPFGDSGYYDSRPGLAIAPPSGANPESALDLDGFFGLHPAMTALHGLYQSGWVAALPAVHYPGASLSHFVGQDYVEYGMPSVSSTGWLGRYLATLPGDAGEKAFALTGGVPRSLLGSVPVSAVSDLASMNLASTSADRSLLGAMMATEYARAPLGGHPYDAAVKAAGNQLLADINELQNVNGMPVYNGAVYPATTFGRQMRQAAGLLKTRGGIELLAVDFGGWDTHRNQGAGQSTGTQSMLLNQLSEGINAFFTDLGSSASDVLVLAITEFGRTVAENGSGGTDHGNASTWLAVGPRVKGGIRSVNGWPGLAPAQQDRGRYLAQSTDFRDVYGEVLNRFLGVSNPASLLAGYTPKNVGFL
ncbi:MAG: DUF1501 domain-containing protein [Pseudomonadota bacterium]